MAGKTVELKGPADAIAQGIALIPEDRLRQGVVLEHSVADNISLSVFDRISKRGWISKQKWSDLAAEKIKSLKVKTASAAAAVRTLSGGNQQKVVLAKWLASDPRIVIFDEPTAGIDIGSKSEIIQLIRELARQGKAIIVISSELNELLAACDRILVMSDGRLLRDMRRDEFEDPTAGITLQRATCSLPNANSRQSFKRFATMAEAMTPSLAARLGLTNWRQNIIYIGFVGIFIFFAITLGHKGFLDTNNLLNIVRQTAPIAIMAVAMTYVLAAGEIDLSIGAVAGLASVAAAMAMDIGGVPLGNSCRRCNRSHCRCHQWRHQHAHWHPDLSHHTCHDGCCQGNVHVGERHQGRADSERWL